MVNTATEYIIRHDWRELKLYSSYYKSLCAIPIRRVNTGAISMDVLDVENIQSCTYVHTYIPYMMKLNVAIALITPMFTEWMNGLDWKSLKISRNNCAH